MRQWHPRLLATVGLSLYVAYGIWELGRYAGWLSQAEHLGFVSVAVLAGVALAAGVGLFFADGPQWDLLLLRHLAVFAGFFFGLHLTSPFIIWTQWPVMDADRLAHLLVRALILAPAFTLAFAGTAFTAAAISRQRRVAPETA